MRLTALVRRLALTLAALALSLPVALPTMVRAQDFEPGGLHAPPKEEDDPEKGPNLELPAWLVGDAREELEAAIKTYDKAYLQLRRQGPRKARPAIEQAVEALEKAKQGDSPTQLPDYYLGICHQLLGDDKTGAKHLELALEAFPEFFEALVELGDIDMKAKRYKQAAERYDRALELNPKYAHGYKMRAEMRIREARFREARDDVNKGLELKPDDPELKARAAKLKYVLDGPDWPKDKNFVAESKNYVIRTNVSQEFADSLSEKIEGIRKLYGKVFPKPRGKRKSPIVVFASKAEYHKNGGPKMAGGHYDPLFKILFLFRYQYDYDTTNVLYHEGLHQYVDQVLPDAEFPQWFNEGLGDMFGGCKVKERGQRGGTEPRPSAWRLPTIKAAVQRNRFVPFDRLMRMSRNEMYGRNAGLHYAEAWSIVYFLMWADGGEYQKLLKNYWKQVQKGKDRFEAYDKAFGKVDMKGLQNRWKDFVSKLDMPKVESAATMRGKKPKQEPKGK